MSEVNVVKHARPMMLKDGNRHVWPTLASMVYLSDGTTPLADENGNLTVDHTLSADNATDSEKLGGVPAAEYLTQEDAADTYLMKTAQAADSAKLNGKEPEYYHQPFNILYNSNFRDPVNRTGQTSYNLGETIDLWISNASTNVITITTEGLSVVSSGRAASSGIYQQLILPTRITDVTMAVKITGYDTMVASGTLLHDSKWNAVCEKNTDGIKIQVVQLETNEIQYRIYHSEGVAKTSIVEWAALYQGIYTADTLPPYTPKGYETELLNCSVRETGRVHDSSKLGGKPPEYYCNHLVNRLDNSNFKIATVGYDGLHGTIRYAADRWKISSSGTSVSYDATTGVMTIQADATSQYRTGLDQGLAYIFTGKTLTMAICDADDNVYCGSGTIQTADGALVDVVVTDSFTLRLRQYEKYLSAAILCVPSKSIGVKWVALYEGEYTVDTLPPYVPKDRNLEEIACAGYYQRYTASQNWAWYFTGVSMDTQNLRVCMPLPYPMRANPTVTIAKPQDMTLFLPVAEGTTYGINSVLGTNVYPGTNMLMLYLEANVTLTKGRTLSVRLNTDIELSADI